MSIVEFPAPKAIAVTYSCAFDKSPANWIIRLAVIREPQPSKSVDTLPIRFDMSSMPNETKKPEMSWISGTIEMNFFSS